MYSSMSMISYMLIIIMMLMSVAFFTLFERKLLSYIHKRKGPNKTSMMGILQPMSDAVKLLSKETTYYPKMNFNVYLISPAMMMIISLMLWTVFPTILNKWSFNQSIMFMLMWLSMSVYPIMMGGWASSSNYALIGTMRSIAQTISYEVSLSIIIISALLMIESMNFFSFMKFSTWMPIGIYMYPIMIMFFMSSLAETNRTPFDFVEGESELVSGFNIEYFGSGFTLIFLTEYSMIIWISGINSIMFFTSLPIFMMTTMISMTKIWIRGTMPRMRYDELMYMCWKIFLPVSIIMMSMLMMFKYMILMNMLDMK